MKNPEVAAKLRTKREQIIARFERMTQSDSAGAHNALVDAILAELFDPDDDAAPGTEEPTT